MDTYVQMPRLKYYVQSHTACGRLTIQPNNPTFQAQSINFNYATRHLRGLTRQPLINGLSRSHPQLWGFIQTVAAIAYNCSVFSHHKAKPLQVAISRSYSLSNPYSTASAASEDAAANPYVFRQEGRTRLI